MDIEVNVNINEESIREISKKILELSKKIQELKTEATELNSCISNMRLEINS